MNKNENLPKTITNNEPAAKETKKSKFRFNIVDFILILFVLSAVVALILYFLPGVTSRLSHSGEVEITYVLEFRGVDDAFISNIQNGDKAYSAEQNFAMGNVKSVATGPYSTLEYDSASGGAIMKDHPKLKTLIVTITASALYTDGEGYSINGERIAVGEKYNVRFPNFVGSAYCTQLKVLTK